MKSLINKSINSIVKVFLEVFIFDKKLRSKLKTDFAKNYFKKYIKKLNTKNPIYEENEQIIWQYWHDKKENAPKLIKKCLESVEKYENDKKIVVLSLDTIKNYVDLPQRYYDLVNSKKMSIAHFSDILRLYLLNKYGGLWLDSTVYLTDKIPDDIWKSDFCTMQKDPKTDVMQDRMACFLIRAKKGSNNIRILKNIFDKYWKENDFAINYFMFEHVSTMISHLEATKQEWDKMPYFDLWDSSELQWYLYDTFDKEKFEKVKSKTPIHKLSYKNAKKYSTGDSFYDYIIDNYHKKKVSVVIPTLQKNVEILEKLIKSLDKDTSVSEIILIDNSTKGFEQISSKLKVVNLKENIYVNPAWNLGVSLAKEQIVALLNDDIIISDNFCKNVIHKMTPDMGIVGYNMDFVEIAKENKEPPEEKEIIFKKTDFMDTHYGITMFFYKSSYYKIPEEIKIVYGDVWLYHKNLKDKKINYRISNQPIYHWGSLSSSSSSLSDICKNDSKIYAKLMVKPIDRLFSYDNIWDCFKLRIFGVTFKISKPKRITK